MTPPEPRGPAMGILILLVIFLTLVTWIHQNEISLVVTRVATSIASHHHLEALRKP